MKTIYSVFTVFTLLLKTHSLLGEESAPTGRESLYLGGRMLELPPLIVATNSPQQVSRTKGRLLQEPVGSPLFLPLKETVPPRLYYTHYDETYPRNTEPEGGDMFGYRMRIRGRLELVAPPAVPLSRKDRQ